LKKIAYGSEPSQSKVLATIRQYWPHIELVQTYGMTEIGIQKTLTCPADSTRFRLDEKFNVGRLVSGTLQVKSMTPLLCYLNVESQTSPGEWFETHDRAVEKDGFLHVLGRDGDLINIAGRKFFPFELEDLIMRLPDALDVTVSSVADEFIGNSITAKIVIPQTLTESDFRKKLKFFLEQEVPYFMRPQRVLLSYETEATARFKKNRQSE
jgi:acyl-coenzyme A synthetase/AMP-(fatty) acid ligase